MAHLQRLIAFALLSLGVALVFLGLTRSLGFTPGSVLVSVVAIAALLYTGGVWFGAAGGRGRAASLVGLDGPLLFDVHGRLVGGAAAGQPVASQFPESARGDIERSCAAALAGRTGRFPSTRAGASVVVDVLPVLGADGTIVYGILVPAESGSAVAATV
jgi:hypothetical protein